MSEVFGRKQKIVVVGAGPVGTLAALYAAGRGDDVEVYEFREGIGKAFLNAILRFMLCS
jgi:flavin-dependent dehydrogenase